MSSNSSAGRSESSRRAGRTGRAGVAAKSALPPAEGELTKQDFERLAAVRYAIRRLVRQTELEARRLGISPQQYLLMLAIKGFPGRDWANITELAEYLQIRHNAVIGLVNRAVTRGLVVRMQDADRTDRRVVQVRLTETGEHVLQVAAQGLVGERANVRMALEDLYAADIARRGRDAALPIQS